MPVIHPKVRWAALAGALVTAVAAFGAAGGQDLPAWVGALVAAVAAFAAGYVAPAGVVHDDGGDR